MKNLVEAWIKIYLEQKYKIEEMADSIKDIKKDIKDSRMQILTHLVKIYFWRNETTDYDHWRTDIHSFLPTIPMIKGKNKYPTKDQLMNWGFQTTLESIQDQLKVYIDKADKSENTEEQIKRRKGRKLLIPKYNEDNLQKFMTDYILWLCNMFSDKNNKGAVTNSEVYNILDSLYNKYHK